MQQTLLIPVSPEELKQMVADAVAGAITSSSEKEKKYLTGQELCERFSVSLPTVHSWMNKGLIQAKKISGRTLFDASEVDNAVQAKVVYRYRHGKGK